MFADAKSGGSGGGGGRGGGGGTGRAGGRGGRISGKKVALGAAAVGVAGYAAYKQNHPSPHRFHSNRKSRSHYYNFYCVPLQSNNIFDFFNFQHWIIQHLTQGEVRI